MTLAEAYAAVQRILAPLPAEHFFDQVLGQRFVKVPGQCGARTDMLGADPRRTILSGYGLLAPHLGSHAEEPIGPAPQAGPVTGEADFRALIEAFHQRRYTVRVPSVRRIAPDVDALCRALEMILHQPVKAEVFWSRGDAKAPVHHDDYDLIALQLCGRKRWFIETDPSPLPNPWPHIPVGGPPRLGPHQEVEVEAGDLLYIPRGAQHRVDALSESLHLSIGFVPLTLREAILAALDHLSDLDRSFRETADGRLGLSVRKNRFGELPRRMHEGATKLASLCGSADFVAEALQRRSSRAVSDLDKLVPTTFGTVDITSRVRHTSRAMSHLTGNADKIDFAHPGGHIYIHRGASEAVAFIADTAIFRVGDIPGEVDDKIRTALVERFVAAGFLELAP